MEKKEGPHLTIENLNGKKSCYVYCRTIESE